MDFNDIKGKLKVVLCGLAGLLLLAFGAKEMGNRMTDQAQLDLNAPATTVSPTTR